MAVANINNKRKSERIELLYYVRIFENPTDEFRGHLVDISEKGMMITSDAPFEPNKTYTLKLDTSIDLDMSEELSFVAKNVWCDGSKSRNVWDGGFQFVDVSDEAAAVFHAYLNGDLV